MEISEILFESYNMAVEESFNELFMSNNSHEILNVEDEKIVQHLNKDLEKWADTPNEDIGGVSPRDYFNTITELDQLIELFKMAAKLCDNDIPDPLLDRLHSFNDDAVNGLLELALDNKFLYDDDEQIISVMAIKTLGKWKATSSLEPLIKLMFEIDREMDLVIEEILSAMVEMGQSAANRIMEILNESSNIGCLEEYLLDTLVKMGVTEKDRSFYDLIYRSIKSTFNKMENKLFGAICLGNLGDGRAIPVLRGFIEKNLNTIDYETFLEVKASIHRLGGNIDDINVQFN